MKNSDFNGLQVIVDDNKMICYCKQVTQSPIERAMKLGAITLSDIQQSTGACTGNQCKEMNPSVTCCSGDINRILNNDGSKFIKTSLRKKKFENIVRCFTNKFIP